MLLPDLIIDILIYFCIVLTIVFSGFRLYHWIKKELLTHYESKDLGEPVDIILQKGLPVPGRSSVHPSLYPDQHFHPDVIEQERLLRE